MKAILSLVAVSIVAVGMSALLGCESMHHHHDSDNSSSMHSQTSGGNGAFGESTAKPGTYNTDNGPSGNTNSNTNNNR
jgi:hypothetical protein